MNIKYYDTAVVGLGPASAKFVWEFRKYSDKDMVILEQNSEDNLYKICSGIMPPINMAILDVPLNIVDTPLNIFRLYFKNDVIELKFKYPPFYMIDRRNGKLGKYLYEKTKKENVDIRLDSEVVDINPRTHILTLKNNDKIKYNTLVLGCGSNTKFQKLLGINPLNVFCTHIEVPYKDVIDRRKNSGHFYADFNLTGVGYCGYTPYENSIGFCQVFSNNKFFTKQEKIRRFNEYVWLHEGVNLYDYDFKAKTVNFYPKTYYGKDNIYTIGEMGNFGDVGGGLIATHAKSGSILAHKLCNVDTIKEEQEFNNRFSGNLSKIGYNISNSNVMNLGYSIIRNMLRNKKFGKPIWENVALNLLNKKLAPFSDDVSELWNKNYFSVDEFGYDNLDISYFL